VYQNRNLAGNVMFYANNSSQREPWAHQEHIDSDGEAEASQERRRALMAGVGGDDPIRLIPAFPRSVC
jgi:hypothetical protein